MDEVPFLSDLDSTGKLVAILRLKKEAASKRMIFYRLRNRQNNAIIAKGDKLESDNRATYEFMHIEHIFTMIQSIESFHGALASAHKMTSSEEKNVDDVLSSLIEPIRIDKIRSKLREEEMVINYIVISIIAIVLTYIPVALAAHAAIVLAKSLVMVVSILIRGLLPSMAFFIVTLLNEAIFAANPEGLAACLSLGALNVLALSLGPTLAAFVSLCAGLSGISL